MNGFVCDKCGKCCRKLKKSLLYADLDDGTGTCIYYNFRTHLCKIYEKRPILCNIKDAYIFFQNEMTYEEYLSLNYDACKILKEEN